MVASAEWIAFLIEGGSATTLTFEHMPLQGYGSAFQAEAVSLDLAIGFVARLLAGDDDPG